MSVHHKCVFGARSTAVDWAGTGLLTTTECPDNDAIHDHRVGIELAGPLEQMQEIRLQPVPDASLYPIS